MSDAATCPICTMPDPLDAVDGDECATCGHEWPDSVDSVDGVDGRRLLIRADFVKQA